MARQTWPACSRKTASISCSLAIARPPQLPSFVVTERMGRKKVPSCFAGAPTRQQWKHPSSAHLLAISQSSDSQPRSGVELSASRVRFRLNHTVAPEAARVGFKPTNNLDARYQDLISARTLPSRRGRSHPSSSRSAVAENLTKHQRPLVHPPRQPPCRHDPRLFGTEPFRPRDRRRSQTRHSLEDEFQRAGGTKPRLRIVNYLDFRARPCPRSFQRSRSYFHLDR